jgi:ABC-2 type transport system permease protein
MRGFFTFTIMNLKMYLRDVQMVFWTMMFPIILMSLLGVAFGAIGDVTFNVAIIDNDDSETSKMFIDTLKDVSSLDVSTPSKLSDARSEMKNGDMDLIIVIPADFEERVQRSYNDGNSSSNLSNSLFGGLFNGDSGSTINNSENISGSRSVNLTVYYNDADLDKSFSALAIVEKVSTNLNKGLTGREDIIVLQPEKTTGGNFEFIDYIAPGILAMSIMQTGIYGMSLFIVSARQNYRKRRFLLKCNINAYDVSGRCLHSHFSSTGLHPDSSEAHAANISFRRLSKDHAARQRPC